MDWRRLQVRKSLGVMNVESSDCLERRARQLFAFVQWGCIVTLPPFLEPTERLKARNEPLSPLVPRGEREGNGGSDQMRRAQWRPLPPLFLSILWLTTGALAGQPHSQTPYVREPLVELNDNGAWSWFMDERAIIDHDWLLAGSVRANGNFRDSDLPGWGNVELSVYNLAKGKLEHVLLHEHLEQDDHD